MSKTSRTEMLERRRRRVIRQPQTPVIAALFVVSALVSAVFMLRNEPEVPGSGEPLVPVQQPGPGELPGYELFQAACAPCHGVAAAGNPAAGIPALNSTGDAWLLTEDEIVSIVTVGTDKMPGNGSLFDREQILAIVEFLKTFWTEEQIAAYEAGGA